MNPVVVRRGVWVLCTLAIVVAVYLFIQAIRNPPASLVECSSSAMNMTNSVTGATPSDPFVQLPLSYESEPPIMPRGLKEPEVTLDITPSGAPDKVVLIMYPTDYLNALRIQTGSNFRGIARVDAYMVPAGVKVTYGGDATTYVIASTTCFSARN